MGVQVRTATFQEDGVTPRPLIEKQFISFSWGGKNIEDFDLLVVFNNDRYEADLIAPFEATVTNYTYIDGQTYWGNTTHAREISFTLATDGIDSKKMEEFKSFFKAGEVRELILAEFPYRYAMARLNTPPRLSMLPFEKTIEKNGRKFRTTEYKGEIALDFILDDPYWYSNTSVHIAPYSEEALKDNYETGTPLDEELGDYEGVWFPHKQIVKNGKLSLAPDIKTAMADNTQLYYCGTAKAYPIITITFPIYKVDNKFSFVESNFVKVCSLQIGDNENILSMILPPFLAAYNTAIETIEQVEDGISIVELSDMLRERTTSAQMRTLIMTALHDWAENKLTLADSERDSLYTALSQACSVDEMVIMINSQNGMVQADYGNGSTVAVLENAGSCVKTAFPIINPQIGQKLYEIKLSENIKPTDFKIDYNYTFN